MRFVRSEYAQIIAEDNNFNVVVGQRNYNTVMADPYMDEDSENNTISEAGFLVDASRDELLEVGLISSSLEVTYIVY